MIAPSVAHQQLHRACRVATVIVPPLPEDALDILPALATAQRGAVTDHGSLLTPDAERGSGAR